MSLTHSEVPCLTNVRLSSVFKSPLHVDRLGVCEVTCTVPYFEVLTMQNCNLVFTRPLNLHQRQ